MNRFALALSAATLLLSGCLERKEAIRVHEGGHVDVVHELTGDPFELDPSRPDALPSSGPWIVEDRDFDSVRAGRRLKARLAFASFDRVDEIPETHGERGDPAPLRARTTLAMRAGKAPGTTEYAFERRYPPRAYRWRERAWARTLGAPGVAPDDPGEPSDADRLRVARAALAFEREVAQGFLDQALTAAAAEQADPVARLEAQAAFLEWFDGRWRAETLLELPRASVQDQRAFARRFLDETAREAARRSAVALEARVPEAQLHRAYVDARRTLQATETLLDESFEVRVELPHAISLTNGTIAPDGKTAIFRFTGHDLCDREHVLRAVAVGRTTYEVR